MTTVVGLLLDVASLAFGGLDEARGRRALNAV